VDFLRIKLAEIPSLEMCRSGQVLSLLVSRAGLEWRYIST